MRKEIKFRCEKTSDLFFNISWLEVYVQEIAEKDPDGNAESEADDPQESAHEAHRLLYLAHASRIKSRWIKRSHEKEEVGRSRPRKGLVPEESAPRRRLGVAE